MKLKHIFPALVALTVVGCNPPADKPKEDAPAPVAGTTTTPETPAAKLSRDDISADLKGDAYSYYGLSNDKPVSFQWLDNQSSAINSGMQTFELKDIKPEDVTFLADRTGGLSNLGSETISLRKDGVYVTGSDKAKISGDKLELPNGLVPGKTWTNHQELEFQATKIDMKLKWLVKGVESFATKAGKYDGMLVTADGAGEINGKKLTMTYKVWFVKDRGALKFIISTKSPNQPAQTFTFEESK